MPNLVHVQIALALLVLTCGSVLFWPRRDNVLGYVQGGVYLATLFLPLFATSVIRDADPVSLRIYANVMTLGAVCYLIGLCVGAPLGRHARRSLPFTFGPLLSRGDDDRLVSSRARIIGVGGIVALAGSFVLLGYVPLLAADRTAAKYGVGVYRSGFLRGSLFFHIALALASTILPILLVMLYRRRRTSDIVITSLLTVALIATLSRSEALIGPLLFGVALIIHRKYRPFAIVGLVTVIYLGGALANELLLPSSTDSTQPFATRVAAGAPDIRDHIGFITGYRLLGSEEVGLRPIATVFSVRKGYYDPAAYAIRTLTGLPDTTEIASGGIRLPAPVWGYASSGLLGVALWPFISGVFAGWGTTLVRRMLTRRDGSTASMMDLILGATFYLGVFGPLETFYFPQRSGLVAAGVAVAVCISLRARRAARRAVASPAAPSGDDNPEPVPVPA